MRADRSPRCICTSPTTPTGAGTPRPGEICEIEGAGPVPVSTARRLSSDAIIKALVVKGTDVTRVVSLGRTIPAALATAIRTEQPTCCIEGCEVDRHLELDHNIPHAIGGETSRENLDPLCGHHHDVKTRRDLRRLGPPGRQRLVEHRRIPSRVDRRRVAVRAVPSVVAGAAAAGRAAGRYRPSLVGRRSGKSAARPSALARKASPMSAVSNIAAFQFAMYSRPSATEWSRV